MNIFDIHRQIVDDYADYIRSFINISDLEIKQKVEDSLSEGRLWPQPLLQFNPAYKKVGTVEDVIASGLLHDDIQHIFEGYSLRYHQYKALELGINGTDFIVTSGTGSGKSLTYIGTVFNHLLINPDAEGVTAVVVYPMNALINSQANEFNIYKNNYEKNTRRNFPITFGQYTGQEKEEQRQSMRDNPPQILLTNYMMLELLLTRVQERPIRDAIFKNLQYLVFDELHTYRGRQGADVSMLIRRIHSQCKQSVCSIGTSATMVSVGNTESQREQVARTASKVFGRSFKTDQIVDETLTPSLGATMGTQPTRQELHLAITAGIDPDAGESELRKHPLAVWLENRIALEKRDGRLTRRMPMGFDDVVEVLAGAS
ncbi:MAG: DEAD/DEAH box helicase [Candidatus Dadabacteria bacterium]|nr:DEAD/DEAH box helicase [Candidatus Dadabacteria bacterium]